MRLLILNGPNLNLLGKREVSVYGSSEFTEYLEILRKDFPAIELEYFQSNLEGELIEAIQKSDVDGVILNAAGYTHTSVALRDAILAVETPVLEVHISNVFAREEFRHVSLIGGACIGSIGGFGMQSYRLAVQAFADRA